jgi:transglutaminase-like putative cysteine protease
MSFSSIYRGTFYLMLFFATLTLSVDVPESTTARFYPLAVAIAAVIAFFTVDRYPSLGLSRGLSNWLALGSIGLVMIEYSSNPQLLLLSLAHWLVYLQLIKMFLPKRIEDDWFLFLLGLMQVLVGAVESQSDLVGQAMTAWALLALWVLALFSLHRDALRYLSRPERAVESASTAEDPYPGLLNLPFIVAILRVTATTLALGGVIFLAMPRRSSMARVHTAAMPGRHLTGFDEEVKLGQLGEILENDSVVMSVELYDRDGTRVAPPGEPLWRGVTMSSYDKGRWLRPQRANPGPFPSTSRLQQANKLIEQHIRLEPTDLPVLFGLRPIFNATSTTHLHSLPRLNSADGTIIREDPRSENYDYIVLSAADPSKAQPGERRPHRADMGLLLEVPLAIREPLRRIAEQQVRDIPADAPLRRAHALEQYFLSSGFFKYTLHLTMVDRDMDPVLDFLINRKEGHCGYFASALALLLRSVGLPARMVGGFKGGDWNDIAHVLSVRQKHAHSWVEVYVSPGPDEEPAWYTLDPTPATERNEAVASVGGFVTNFRLITDLVRYIWVFYIVGYNADRQQFLLYDPIRSLIEMARKGFGIMGQALQRTTAALFGFRDFAAFISFRGFFVSFILLLALVGVVRGSLWLWGRLLAWYRGNPEDSGSLSASQVSYRRLTQLLAGFGLERPAAETQFEFASRASAFLTGRGASTAGVADVPPLVVAAYYSVRFGQRELAPKALERLESRLDALEASLTANSV